MARKRTEAADKVREISRRNEGFTLIEIVVVMSIIAVLASLVVGAIRIARTTAIETQKRVTLRDLNIAFQAFNTKKGQMPANYGASGACDETASQGNYEKSMQELVDAGTLKAIPRRNAGASSSYCYYNYINGGVPGFTGKVIVVQTTMESGSSTTGPADSCRPWDAGTNWCDKNNDNEWCLCVPY